jgi:murein DD-endopeptidase MepM/ murein hydrolase activator NlpD
MISKTLIYITACFFVILAFGAAVPAAAQDDAPEGPLYIVQPGDTLSKIAVRFNIELADLTDANGISDPNQLFVGDGLVLPGVDWVSGTLDVQEIEVGETFRSLRRRYQLAPVVLGRVSGVISPTQVYAGYPLMMPGGIGEDLNAARAGIAAGESLLLAAATRGANPWAVSAANQMMGLWVNAPGDVVLLPGTDQPGPGGLPSPLTLEIEGGDFIQGKTTIIKLGAGGLLVEASGSFIEKDLHFFPYEDGFVVLQGVHVMTEPGPYLLTIQGVIGEGNPFEFSQMVYVEDGGYGRETLTVDPLYLDLTVDRAEAEFIASMTQEATPVKMWSAFFSKPTPFDIFINSHFGTRRSYNGSEFTYFHSGTDFGGGTGADVLCPADGKVVFAGPLDIRGNATLIDHGWGIYTGYWHQSEIFVEVGDEVKEGQIIGLVGNTGRSSGAHLHWEVWAGGVQVEPLDWLVELYP